MAHEYSLKQGKNLTQTMFNSFKPRRLNCARKCQSSLSWVTRQGQCTIRRQSSETRAASRAANGAQPSGACLHSNGSLSAGLPCLVCARRQGWKSGSHPKETSVLERSPWAIYFNKSTGSKETWNSFLYRHLGLQSHTTTSAPYKMLILSSKTIPNYYLFFFLLTSRQPFYKRIRVQLFLATRLLL